MPDEYKVTTPAPPHVVAERLIDEIRGYLTAELALSVYTDTYRGPNAPPSHTERGYAALSDAAMRAWITLCDAAEERGVTLRQLDDWLTEHASNGRIP